MSIIKDRKEIESIMGMLDVEDVQEFLRNERYKLAISAPCKIVFLDFDGVLNSGRFLTNLDSRARTGLQPGSVAWSAHELDSVLIDRLNMLLTNTGAVVVVSSSWRIGRTTTELQRILEHKGFTGNVVAITPEFQSGTPRSEEIKSVVRKAGELLEAFVVLDDDDSALIPGHFVQTYFDYGLRDRDVLRAMEILNRSKDA